MFLTFIYSERANHKSTLKESIQQKFVFSPVSEGESGEFNAEMTADFWRLI